MASEVTVKVSARPKRLWALAIASRIAALPVPRSWRVAAANLALRIAVLEVTAGGRTTTTALSERYQFRGE